MMIRPLALAICVTGFAPALLAQTPTITQVFIQDEPVTLLTNEVAGITTFFGLGANDAGQRLIQIDTNWNDANFDFAVFLNSTAVFQEGTPIPGFPSLAFSSSDSIHLNAAGNRAWNLGIRNATISTDSGIFFNSTLVLQEGTFSASPAFSPSTPYIGFFEVLIDDNNDFFVMASIDDPAISSTVDRAAVVFDYNVASNTFTETVLMKEGDQPPGLLAPILDFGTSSETMSRSANGQHQMFIAEVSGGLSDAIFRNTTVVAREGDPSPIPGRNYRILNDVPVSVNNQGQFAFRATLDGATTDDSVILKNGTTRVAQEGAAVPGIPAFTFTGFGTGPVLIDNNGSVTWFGDWNDPDTTRDRGMFRDSALVLQEGVTTVGDHTVVEILGVSTGYAQSPDGKYLLVKVRYENSIDAVLLLDFTVACAADLDDGSGTGTPDDAVDVSDLLYFLVQFEIGALSADLDNGTNTGTQDNAVDVSDLIYFLIRFEAGC
jgi:hypothetical protein